MRRGSFRNTGPFVLVALLSFVTVTNPANAQLVDNIGTEFFIGFMPNEDEEDDDMTTELLVASDSVAMVSVQYPAINPTLTTTVSVSPGEVTRIELGREPAFNWTPGEVDSNVVRVTSDVPVTIYAVNRQDASTDAAVALPIDALGTEYIVSAYHQYYEYSTFAVVGVHDGTSVTITPTVDLQGGHAAGTPIQLTLNRGEAFLGQSLGDSLTADGDVTGTLVESTLPVVLSNGHVCAAVRDSGGSCDHLFEIAQPVPSWGLSAIAVPPAHSPEGTWYRVLAAEDNTSVTLNGTALGTLNRAEFTELEALQGPQVFEADRPILVTQYHRTISNSNGDPSMLTVQPVSQYLNHYTFATIGGNQFRNDYLAIIAADSDISAGTMLFDGAPVAPAEFSTISGTGYSYAILSLSEGSHTTSSDSPHQIVVQGVDPFDTYMYHGGTQYEGMVETAADMPLRRTFALQPNFPNPFTQSTRISFELDGPMHVSLRVFDVLGREVAVLVNAHLPGGTHDVEWNGRDASGVNLPAGLYLNRIEAGGQSSSRRMILVR